MPVLPESPGRRLPEAGQTAVLSCRRRGKTEENFSGTASGSVCTLARMPMGNMTWAALLEGLIGSILTGVIAGFSVWWTVRRDRRLSEEARLHEAITRLLASCATFEAKIVSIPDESDLDEWRGKVKALKEVYEWRSRCLDVWSRARRSHPGFSRTVNACQLWLAYELTAYPPAIQETYWFRRSLIWTLQAFDGEIVRFLSDPQKFDSVVKSRRDVGELALRMVNLRMRGESVPYEWEVSED